MTRIGPEEVRARYGVDPKQVPDFIALRGDPSDKVTDAPGVGAMVAAPCCNDAAASKRRSGQHDFLPWQNPCGSTVNRHDEQEGAAAEYSEPKANLG
jgi:hypothetical protein